MPLWHVASSNLKFHGLAPRPLAERCKVQLRPLHSITGKAHYLLTYPKTMTLEEKTEAVEMHQKLWVAHYSIHNHQELARHWKMFNTLQLFENPKDVSTQQYYLGLLKKDKEKLTLKELQELVDLYQLALQKAYEPTWRWCLKKKLAEYNSLLPSLGRGLA